MVLFCSLRKLKRNLDTNKQKSISQTMSFNDVAVQVMVAQLSLAADGAFLGIGAAYVAYLCLRKLMSTSSALRKIREAPYVQPSDLRSLLGDSNAESLVIVRGSVEVKSDALRGNDNGSSDVSQKSGDRCVILQRSQMFVHDNNKGPFGWSIDLHSLFYGSWKEREASSIRMVPFVLLEAGKRPESNSVVVSMEGSRHPLPLTSVYLHLQSTSDSPYTYRHLLFGCDYPIGVLTEEKILPLGKDISVVGLCNLRDGIPEIKSCKDLPCYLSELTKDQILADLSFKTKVLMWSGILFGSLAIGVLGYSIARWKGWRHQRQAPQLDEIDAGYAQLAAEEETEDVPDGDLWDSVSLKISAQLAAEEEAEDVPDGDLWDSVRNEIFAKEETDDVPDGELCAICVLRRRRSAFVPCGHLVCCQRCALSVEREKSPECPVCRQPVRRSVRTYG